MPLTDLVIKNARPTKRRLKISDGGGLHVEISPLGVKTWKMSYRFGGKQKTVSGGRYPEVKLASARAWREEVKATLRGGRDPALEARRVKQETGTVQRDKFESVGREWYAKNKARWEPRYAALILRRLERDAFRVIGAIPIAEVSHRDILDLIARYERREALEVARKVLNHVSAIMRYAIASGRRSAADPVPDTRDSMAPRPQVQHMAKLPRGRLLEFYGRLNDSKHDPVTKLALKWTILTMVRTNETRFMQASEIEGRGTDELVWRIPGARMKTGREHLVPLPKQAHALLDEMEQIAMAERSVWMFPQTTNPKRSISENRMLYCLYDLGYKGIATVHGFRGLASTILNEQVTPEGARRFDADWIELQLAHVEANSVRGAYNAAQYLVPRRHMLQWWGDFLEDHEAVGKML